MLESITGSTQNWSWGAYGKHPVANDYFRVGKKLPLMNLFADWVDKGYPAVASKENNLKGRCSWRFWARGSGKQDIVCGVIMNSSDSLGRPYPLLIMGTGQLKYWDDQWDLLPLAVEKTWSQIEYLSSRMFNDVKDLETSVRNIRPPHPEWPEFIEKRRAIVDVGTPINHEDLIPNFRKMKEQAVRLSAQLEGFISLDQKTSHDEFTLILLWHFLFKSSGKNVPNAVFIGGTMEKTYLAFFNRPLNSSDFVHLWSFPLEGAEEKQRDI
jgi:type VI secretion system protein VasJ